MIVADPSSPEVEDESEDDSGNDSEDDPEDASDASSLSHSAPTAPPTRIRTLDSHTKFGKALREAIRRKGWSKDDKSDKDFFDHIDWTPTANGNV